MAKRAFVGRWKITSMDQWDQDFVNLDGEGFISFDGDRGELGFGAVRGEMHCIVGHRDGAPVVEWTWAGNDEGDEASGRGWARLDGKDKLVGHIYLHMGDDSRGNDWQRGRYAFM